MKITKRQMLFFVLYCMGLFALDYISKQWTIAHIHLMSWMDPVYPYGGIGIFRDFLGIDFSLNYVRNTGGAWGLFADFQVPLLIARIGLIVSLMIYLFFLIKHSQYVISLTMVIAGALCNIFDMFAYGFVIDMLHFRFWGYDFPVFNCADSSICMGVGLLLFQSVRDSIQARRANVS